MATYFPPQQLHGETDSVYDTIRGLGGVLYMPPGNANGVNQFVYPDDSTLAGTIEGAPTFGQSGLVPEILGGSPQATFEGDGDKINYTVALNDPLQMSGGGSWVFCLTPGTLADLGMAIRKSSDVSPTRHGFAVFMRTTREISIATSDNTSTATVLNSAPGAFEFDERFLITVTLDGLGNAKIYKNCTEIASDTGLQVPSNTASPMGVGNTASFQAWPIEGPLDYAALIPGVILTAANCQTIATLSGIVS